MAFLRVNRQGKRMHQGDDREGTTSSRLPSVVLDLDGLDPLTRGPTLHDFFFPAVEVSLAASAAAGASARIEMWQLGSILVVDGQTPEVTLRRSARQVARDGIDHWTLRVLRNGVLTSRTGDRAYRQHGGDVMLDSMTEDFADHWSQSSWVSFVIPRDGFEKLEFVNREKGALHGPAVPLFADFASSLVRRLRAARPEDSVALSEVAASMIRGCIVSGAGSDGMTVNDLAHRQREHVRSIIAANLTSPGLSAERICELTGLSRSALYRLFERTGGVARFIQDKRLALVLKDLRNPALAGHRISDLAERRGFNNAAAFNRAFRRKFGHTPSEARRTALSTGFRMDRLDDRAGGFLRFFR
jgi:AraC-like DNA-binding protein